MTCGRILSHFGLIYFQFNNDNNNLTNDYTTQMIVAIIMVLTFVLFNVYLLYYFYNINKIQNNYKHQWQLENEINCNSNSDNLNFWTASNDDDDNHSNYNCNCTIGTFFKIILWMVLYLSGIGLTIFYIILHTLPKHNILSVNEDWQLYPLQYSLSFMLALTSTYVVPRFVDSCISKPKIKLRVYIVFVLRSMLSFAVPFVTSFLFLGECGKYWTQLWNECTDDPTSFDYTQIFNIGIVTQKIKLLNHGTVCSTNVNYNNICNINFNYCIRQFLDFWMPVITLKLILFIFNPFVYLFIKFYNIDKKVNLFWSFICQCKCKCGRTSVKQQDIVDNELENSNDDELSEFNGHKLGAARTDTDHDKKLINAHVYESSLSRQKEKDKRDVNIDSQYVLLATKLELCIVFAMISPYLFVIISVAMITNGYCYQIMIKKYKWKINNQLFSIQQFPIQLLFFSVLVEQGLLIVLSLDMFDQFKWIVFCLAVSFVIVDVVFLTKICCQRS